MSTKRNTSIFILFVGLIGCQQYDDIPYLSDEDEFTFAASLVGDDGTDTPGTSSVSLNEFEIGDSTDASALRFTKNDEILISFWGYEELNHVATVQGNGRITVPLVGEVTAEGRTADTLRSEITQRLDELSIVPHPTLRHGDRLSLFVWQNEDLNISTIVQPDGTVTFPLAGRIPVEGRQLTDVENDVRNNLAQFINDPRVFVIPELLGRQVLYDPRVSVLPLTIQPRQVSVLGEVEIPGVQPLRGGMRIMEALAAAQIADTAQWDSVIVIRQYDSNEPSYRRLRLGEFMSGFAPDQNIALQEGDIVMVPRTPIAQVGLIIDQFFTRTRPLFDWWIAGNLAFNYPETIRLNHAINRAAKNAFELSTTSPSIPAPLP